MIWKPMWYPDGTCGIRPGTILEMDTDASCLVFWYTDGVIHRDVSMGGDNKYLINGLNSVLFEQIADLISSVSNLHAHRLHEVRGFPCYMFTDSEEPPSHGYTPVLVRGR